MGKVIAKTDIQIELPLGCYGRIAPRSGLAANHHIDIGGINNKPAQTFQLITLSLLLQLAGVVDQDYRGNVGVVMFNHSQQAFKVIKGDRIAQLICEQVLYPDIEEVEVNLF